MKYLLRPFSKVFPTHFCACSEWAGRWLFGNRFYASGKVRLVRNAIDTKKFAFSTNIRNAMRKELGVEDKLVIGHVGRFMRQKNHDFLLEIFAELYAKRPDACLLLIGEGELEQKIRGKIDKLELSHCVHFLGVRADVHHLLQAMDVFLLPSLYEGLGMVAVEAQASGLITICATTVPLEAKLTEFFVHISLDRSAEEWTDIILDQVHNPRVSCHELLMEQGYDIRKEAGRLGEFYKGNRAGIAEKRGL